MPSVATGANLANRDLIYIGVSGDSDTASIGMGQFAHVMRHNLNMTYLVENNGCYGLTKGKDSATMDTDSDKKGDVIPTCRLILRVGIGVGATLLAVASQATRRSSCRSSKRRSAIVASPTRCNLTLRHLQQS